MKTKLIAALFLICGLVRADELRPEMYAKVKMPEIGQAEVS